MTMSGHMPRYEQPLHEAGQTGEVSPRRTTPCGVTPDQDSTQVMRLTPSASSIRLAGITSISNKVSRCKRAARARASIRWPSSWDSLLWVLSAMPLACLHNIHSTFHYVIHSPKGTWRFDRQVPFIYDIIVGDRG